MPYIILTSGGQELDRLKLVDPILIGRSAECDLPVRDVLMSRRHCRVEPAGRGWRIVDLESKNGIHLGTEKIQRRMLADGDVLRLGRTNVQFFAGEFQPAPNDRPAKPVRPADPFEALAGTISGMVLEQETAEPATSHGWQNTTSESAMPNMARWIGTELAGQPVITHRPAPIPMPRPMPMPRQSGLRRTTHRQMDDVSLQVMPHLLNEPAACAHVPIQAPSVEWRLLLVLAIGSAATVLLFTSSWFRTVLG